LRNWGDAVTNHEFSPAYIYNQLDGGVDDGISIAGAMNLLVSQGCDTLDAMPYNQNDCTTQPTALQIARAAHFKEASWSSVPLDSQLYNLKYALTQGPVEAGVWVYWTNGWEQAGDINYDDIAGLSLAGGHGICIVGYDDTHQMEDGTGALEFINSWGTSWGQSGYGWMSYTYAEKEIE
jgi:C1A family cysteine protease